jgi:hypothetical protein
VVARENGVPVYACVPTSTIDLTVETGKQIVIEVSDELRDLSPCVRWLMLCVCRCIESSHTHTGAQLEGGDGGWRGKDRPGRLQGAWRTLYLGSWDSI